IPTIITQALKGEKVKLGSVSPTRDMNYVSNTVEGFMACAQSEAAIGKSVNLGSGREISIGDLAKLIGGLVGHPLEIETDEHRLRPANSEVERLLASNELAANLIGWTPKTGLEEGLQKTIDWMRDNLNRYRSDVYNV
ncbi:MAG: GDP-mannose 4,6-dehydratase, partial [Chthonomonadales bacterium]